MSPDPKPTTLTWNVFITCSSLAVAYFLYFIYKMVIYTKLKMRFYRQQGINCYYCPLIGRFFRHGAALKNHGDVEYENKFKAREAPERALCTNFGYDVSVVLYDPALIKEFFLNPDNYVKDNLFLELHFPIIGTGLITSEGNQWKGQRKKLSNAFHFEFLKSNLPLTLVTAQKILYSLRYGNMQKVPIMDVLKKITGEVVGKTFFGENLDLYQFQEKPLTEGLTDLLMEIGVLNTTPERYLLGSWLIKKGILPKHKKLMQKIRTLRKLCEKIIQDRKELIKSGKQTTRTRDILDLLLGYSDEKEPQYTEEIIDQFVTLFLAGMDTTAHMLRMAMYFLHAYPEMKELITKEVEQYYKQGGSVTIENLNKLEFMTAFLKETIRTMTPVPRLLPRKALRDHKLGDIAIRKGDLVELEFFYNNFNPEYFGEPDKFNPDRWLDKGKPIEVYGFTPFSGGPRNCIGQHLALIEARVILAEFLIMYNSSLIEGYKLKMEFRLQYEPVDPVLLNLVPKS